MVKHHQVKTQTASVCILDTLDIKTTQNLGRTDSTICHDIVPNGMQFKLTSCLLLERSI